MERWIGRGLLLAAIGIVGLALCGPVLSGDLWWHLSAGRWMIDHAQLPKTDPFSFTAGETPWILQEYGSQVLFAFVERIGGVGALRVLGAGLAIGLLLAVHSRASRLLRPAFAGLATALFAALFALKWELRPHLLSAFFVLAFESFAVPRTRSGPGDDSRARTWIGVALAACLWVQLHAEALFAPIFALALLGASALGAATGIDHGPAEGARWRRPARSLALFGAALGGTLLSPLGLQPHRYALFRRSVPKQYIEEWFPGLVLPGDPRFAPQTGALFVLFASALLVSGLLALFYGWKLLRRRSGLCLERLAFLAVCLVLAVEARRFLWLLWFPLVELLCLLPAARRVEGTAGSPKTATARARTPALLALLGGAGALFVLATTHYPQGAWRAATGGRFAEPTDRLLFPVGPKDVLARLGFEGRLYHPYEWGGYLGAYLWPNALVFLDARTVLFEEVIPERWLAERDPDVARETFARRDVTAIVFKRLVIREGRAVAWRPPDADRQWVRGFADAASELWIRADRADTLDALEALWSELGIPFRREQGFVELAAVVAAPAFARKNLVLPEVAAVRLEGPSLERARAGTAGPSDWLDLAERCLAVRLGRSVRYACERALEAAELPAETRAVLRDRLAESGAAAGLAALRQALP